MLRPLMLQSHVDPEWAQSSRLFGTMQTDKWSPYTWAENARLLASIQGDPQRTDKTAQALLDELAKHTERTASGLVIRYDYDYNFAGYILKAPWYSAFGNAAAAVGLMQIQKYAPQVNAGAMVADYLNPAISIFANADDSGRLWFSEYVAKEAPDSRVDVVNGHFFVIASLYEWRVRTGSPAYDRAINAGLDTIESALPEMIQDGYFSYARGFPQVKDYGQERAVNLALAACRLRASICPVAQKYQALYREWSSE